MQRVIFMFYDKFINLCNKIGKYPSPVAEEMGFHRSDVTRWSKGSVPRRATLQRIADYFQVDINYFLEDEEKPSVPEDEGLLDAELVRDLLQLTPAEAEKVRAFVRGLLAGREV